MKRAVRQADGCMKLEYAGREDDKTWQCYDFTGRLWGSWIGADAQATPVYQQGGTSDAD